MKDIAEWAESQFGFWVDRHWRGGKWILESGPIRLAQYHADILRHVFIPGPDGRLPYDVIGWCEPAKSGKSAIVGLCAEFMALHGERNSTVVMASNKRDQAASIMFKSAADSVDANPHLPNVEAGKYEIAFSNGNVIRAIASNAKGEAGARFSLAVFDELWGYVYTDAERLWSEFKTDPTRLNSVKMATGYGGYLESELWLSVLQKGKAGEPVPELSHITNGDGEPACWRNGRHFTFWSHVCRQPWQTDEWIESQRKSLRPAEFQRMIQTEFVEGVGDFLDTDVWESLIDPGHPMLKPGRWEGRPPVYVGLDIATKPKGDDCAVVGVYPEGDKVKLAFHRVWRGGKLRKRELRLSETVEPYILQLRQNYRLAGVYFDPYQALHLSERLRRAGVRCVEVPQTHATRGPKDTFLYEAACHGRLVLYDHPDIRTMAAYANVKELPNGLVFIQKAGRGTIDLLIALSNCADAAGLKRKKQVRVWR